MKKIFQHCCLYISVLAFVGGLSSCDWMYTYPEGETLLEDFWQSESDVTAMVASCYRSMLEQDFMTRIIQWGEIRSDNVRSDGTKASEDQLNIQEMNILNTNTLANWSTLYVTINYCNTLLYYAPGVVDVDKNFSPARMKALCAEAQAIRALCYFYLVRAFGDVPLRLEPTIDDTKGFDIAKTDGSVVLDSMIVSLNEAKTYALDNYGTSKYTYNKGRFTKQSIRALLADIYLWQGDYARCVQECNEFLEYNESLLSPQQSGSRLNTTLAYQMTSSDFLLGDLYYTGNASESIFELQYTTDQLENAAISALYGSSSDLGQMYANTGELAARFSDRNEIRYTSFVIRDGSEPQIAKYVCSSSHVSAQSGNLVFTHAGTPLYTNWIFYRLPDIYLMKAEALVEQTSGSEDVNTLKEALRCVDVSWLRANPGSDSLNIQSYSTVEQMRQLVLDERQREFMFEGKRWFDLVRKARREGSTEGIRQYLGKYSTLGQNKLKDMNALYLPISKSEMESNRLMEQNPFYKSDETVTAN